MEARFVVSRYPSCGPGYCMTFFHEYDKARAHLDRERRRGSIADLRSLDPSVVIPGDCGVF